MSTSDIVFKIILPIVMGFAPYAVSLWRQRYSLCWAHLPPESMLHIAEEVVPLLSVSYEDQPINNLTQYRFILHNTGSNPFDHEAIVEPLTWQAPGKILSARVVKTDPDVRLSLEHSGQQLSISWQLFNQRCKALIEVRCEGESNVGIGEISGQIRRVSQIKKREVYWLRDGVMVRISAEDIKVLDPLSKSGPLRRSFLRSSPKRDAILLGGVYAVIFLFLLWDFDGDLILISSISVALAALFLFLHLKYRNPYKKFLQSIEDQSDSV